VGVGFCTMSSLGSKPIHSIALQLAHLVERVSRNFGERRLIGFFSLDTV